MKLFRLIPMFTFSGLTLLASAVFLMSGSEAHIINVTAKIEPPMCDARSLGYWANNEGCSQGTGSSDWANEVQALSAEYSGVFAAYTGGDMCAAVWMPNCASLSVLEKPKCRATAHTLAVELNVASGRLHRSAFLAGADDNDPAFYRLHLFESSTIQEALITLEAVLGNPLSSVGKFRDVLHVAERIYTFYEEENPFHPRCIFDPDDILACRASVRGNVTVTNENTAEVSTIIETITDTDDNSSSPADEEGDESEGDTSPPAGGTETEDATVETVVENEVDTNVTDGGCENCTPCGETCADAQPTDEAPAPTDEQPADAPESEEPVAEQEQNVSNTEESEVDTAPEVDASLPQETNPSEA